MKQETQKRVLQSALGTFKAKEKGFVPNVWDIFKFDSTQPCGLYNAEDNRFSEFHFVCLTAEAMEELGSFTVHLHKLFTDTLKEFSTPEMYELVSTLRQIYRGGMTPHLSERVHDLEMARLAGEVLKKNNIPLAK